MTYNEDRGRLEKELAAKNKKCEALTTRLANLNLNLYLTLSNPHRSILTLRNDSQVGEAADSATSERERREGEGESGKPIA